MISLPNTEAMLRLTLDKRLSLALALLSVVLALFSLDSLLSGVFFVTGASVIFPPISGLWGDIEKNWDGRYKRFFYNRVSSEERKWMIRKHWSQTLWVTPYVVFVYGFCAFAAISLGTENLKLLFDGSLFTTGLVSYQAQKRLEHS